MTRKVRGPEGDEQAQAAKWALFKRRAAQQKLDLTNVMASVQGRRFVWWVLEELCQFAAGEHVEGGEDAARRSCFRGGQRDVAISIREALFRDTPELFDLMQQEARQQSAHDARELEQAEAQTEQTE